MAIKITDKPYTDAKTKTYTNQKVETKTDEVKNKNLKTKEQSTQTTVDDKDFNVPYPYYISSRVSKIERPRRVADRVNRRRSVGFGIALGIIGMVVSMTMGGADVWIGLLIGIGSALTGTVTSYGLGKLDNLATFGQKTEIREEHVFNKPHEAQKAETKTIESQAKQEEIENEIKEKGQDVKTVINNLKTKEPQSHSK